MGDLLTDWLGDLLSRRFAGESWETVARLGEALLKRDLPVGEVSFVGVMTVAEELAAEASFSDNGEDDVCSSCLSKLRLLEVGEDDSQLLGFGDFLGDVSLGEAPFAAATLFLVDEISLGKRVSLLTTLTKSWMTPFTKT